MLGVVVELDVGKLLDDTVPLPADVASTVEPDHGLEKFLKCPTLYGCNVASKIAEELLPLIEK
jgi:hypothetical protein